MNAIVTLANTAQDILDKVRNSADLIGSILLRAYLVPVFWLAANNKWNPFDKDSSLDPIIEWFGNADWGLDYLCRPLMLIWPGAQNILARYCSH